MITTDAHMCWPQGCQAIDVQDERGRHRVWRCRQCGANWRREARCKACDHLLDRCSWCGRSDEVAS